MWFKRPNKTRESNTLNIGSRVFGDIHSEDGWNIAGILKGDLIAKGNVRIESDAYVDGDVEGENIWVAGKVKGDIRANKKLFLYSSCSIGGDITYEIVEIEEGAHFSRKSHSTVTLTEMEKRSLPNEENKKQYAIKPPADEPVHPTKHKKIIIQ